MAKMISLFDRSNFSIRIMKIPKQLIFRKYWRDEPGIFLLGYNDKEEVTMGFIFRLKKNQLSKYRNNHRVDFFIDNRQISISDSDWDGIEDGQEYIEHIFVEMKPENLEEIIQGKKVQYRIGNDTYTFPKKEKKNLANFLNKLKKDRERYKKIFS